MREKKQINIRVGANIRMARENAGYTQESLSEILGITPNHLSAIERGISGASLEMIETLCALFGVQSDALIFESPQSHDTNSKLAMQLKKIKPEYQPQVQKIMTALLEIVLKQEK